VLRANQPAHIVLPDLPCKQLTFRWERQRLVWQMDGGAARLNLSGHTLQSDDDQLYLPSRLVIEPQLDEAELLGRAIAGCEPAGRFTLELLDPSALTSGPV